MSETKGYKNYRVSYHHGSNLRRLREIMGMKQEALAVELGSDWNQRKISTLESREVIDEELLKALAETLNVPVESIKTFSEEAAMNNIIGNTINNGHFGDSGTYNFNPLEKWIETLDEHKKALEENKRLYDALLKEKDNLIKEKDEKAILLQKLLNKE